MTFPNSGLTGCVVAILDMTLAQANAANVVANGALSPTGNAAGNTYGVCGVNSGPSTSLALPTQGVNANPSALPDVADPSGMLNLEAAILTQAALVYRM